MNNEKINFFRKFMGFSLSAWVNAGLSLISTPLITRVFSPADVGKINLFITILNLMINFTYFGIDQAFVRFFHEPPGKNNKNSLLGLCLLMSCSVGAVGTVVVFIFKGILSDTVLGYVTYIVPVCLVLSVFANVIIRYVNHYARMGNNVFLFNLQAVCLTVINNVSYIVVALYKANAENAIVLRTIFLVVAGLAFFIMIKKNVKFKEIYVDKKTIKTIILYALPICPAGLLAVANNSIGQILMKTYVSYEMVGIYSNAVTVASIITLIQSGLNIYWEPLVFENYKTRQKQIIKMHHIFSFVMIAFALCIIICQDIIYVFLVGQKFWASKQIFPLMLISPVCYTIAETLGIGIKLSKKTFLNIPIYMINIIVNITVCVILLPKIGVIGAAFSSAISGFVMLVVKSVLGERLYRCSDNYFKLFISLITLFVTAIIHIFVYESSIKYLLYLVAVIIVGLCYIKEIKSIFLLLNDLKNKVLKRNKE